MVKKYLNIKEVSKLLEIKEHIIRYWDSIDPKTNKLRVDGISTKSNGGTRYFNKDNIYKLKQLKNLLYSNGKQNYTLQLATKIISSDKNTRKIQKITDFSNGALDHEKQKKMKVILKNLRDLL